MNKMKRPFPFEDSPEMFAGVLIDVVPEDDRFVIYYAGINPHSSRFNSHHFTFVPAKSVPFPSIEAMEYLADKVIHSYKFIALMGESKGCSNRIKATELRSHFIREYKVYSRNPDVIDRKIVTKSGVYKEIPKQDPDLYVEPTLYAREANDNGRTTFIAGRSFSGKTYNTVQELNKIIDLKRGGSDHKVADMDQYSRIFIMTSSPNAKPWEDLKDPKGKIRIIGFYLPQLIALLKRINDVSENRFPVLLVLDDVFSDMRVTSFKSLILTLRNANISTVVLSQAYKHLTPDSRSSVHQIVCTKFNPMEWEAFIGAQLQKHVNKILVDQQLINEKMSIGRGSKSKIAHIWEEFIGNNMVYFNQREDKLSIIKRDPF